MENLKQQVKELQKNHDFLKDVVGNLVEALTNLKSRLDDKITEEHKETEYGKKEPMLIKNSIERNKIAIKMVDEKFKHLEEKEIQLKQFAISCRFYNRGKAMQIYAS